MITLYIHCHKNKKRSLISPTGEQNFIKQLMNFDKDNISDRVLKKIGQYVAQPDFQPDIIGRVSLAAKSLCMWVRAMEMYGRIYRVVEPKRQRLQAAQSQLREKQSQLQEAKDKLAEVSINNVWQLVTWTKPEDLGIFIQPKNPWKNLEWEKKLEKTFTPLF